MSNIFRSLLLPLNACRSFYNHILVGHTYIYICICIYIYIYIYIYISMVNSPHFFFASSPFPSLWFFIEGSVLASTIEVNLAALLGFSATGIELEPGRHQRACPPWHVGSRRTRILKRKSLQFRIFLSRYGDGPKLLTPKKSWLQFETLCPPFASAPFQYPQTTVGQALLQKLFSDRWRLGMFLGSCLGPLMLIIDAIERKSVVFSLFLNDMCMSDHVCIHTYACMCIYLYVCIYTCKYIHWHLWI